MATMKLSLVLVLLFACTISFHGVLADIICENLPTNVCAFSVSSSGKRCVLENSIKDGSKVEYQCKTSEVVVGSNTAEYIETDKCVSACGVDRKCVGMSSDTLLEPSFIAKLCSPACYHNCPNIVDLYFNLAAGEGVFLPDMCQKQQAIPSSHRRDMVQLQSDSDVVVAPGPDAKWTSPRRNMIEVQSDDSVDAPIAEDIILAADVHVLTVDDAVEAPSADILAADILTINAVEAPASADDVLTVDVVDGPAVAETPTQVMRNARRAMVELLSNGGMANADAPAGDDASTINAPAPSPSYF